MKKRIAACVLAAAMVVGSVGLPNGAFSGAFSGNSIVAEAVTSGNYKYTQTASGECRLTGFVELPSNLVIPAQIDGLKVTAFSGNAVLWLGKDKTAVTSVTVSEGITAINASMFKDFTNLSSVTLPSSLTSIGEGAFTNTAIVNNQSGLKYVGNWLVAADTSITSASIRSGTVGIATTAFNNCSKLTSVTIPNSVQYVGDSVFNGCTSLTSADLSSMTKIPDGLFSGCSSLNNVKLSSSLAEIGKEAFQGTGFSSFDIPDSVVSVGYNAFDQTPLLSSQSGSLKYIDGWLVYADSTLTSLNVQAGTVGIGACCAGNTKLTSVTIPSSVKYISNDAFQSCTALTSVSFSSGLEIIGKGAFQGCNKLDTIALPATLKTISDRAFLNCLNLGYSKGLSIPSSVNSIGTDAFTGCQSMDAIEVLSSSATIGTRAFGYYTTTEKNTDLIVNCYNGSTAQSYASKNGFTINILSGGSSHEHYFTNWTITTAATCTTDGVETGYCSCGQTSTRTITKLGHNVSSTWEVTKAATCTATGTQVQKCTRCGAVINTASIPKTAHTYAVDHVVAPTATEQGYTVYKCSVCGATKNDDYTPATGKTDTRKKGDLNNNGKIDASDLLQVKSHIKKVKQLTGDDFTCADIDGNKVINATDLLKMKAHMKGVSRIW
ncbi:MAG: leucine-rich repeat protein [Ruminococcus sp.]|nr:leucine-rich repeat protein [Ruminococcus sp.]